MVLGLAVLLFALIDAANLTLKILKSTNDNDLKFIILNRLSYLQDEDLRRLNYRVYAAIHVFTKLPTTAIVTIIHFSTAQDEKAM